MRHLSFLLYLLAIHAFAQEGSGAVSEGVRVPFHTAYHEEGAEHADQIALWFGRLGSKGLLTCRVELELGEGLERTLKLLAEGHEHEVLVRGQVGVQVVEFGSFEVSGPGYQRFELLGSASTQGQALRIGSLLLAGDPLEGAHFNLEPRRNAASVHLAYPLEEKEVTAFYCELTADEDPVWSYYMATGWHRGYFGMQVNSKTERRIIFSVWDSSSEAVDRDKVTDEDRVQLLAKGADVVSGSFGNEGTGGHSHLVFNWKTGERQRFLVTAKKDDETHTTFTGYYYRRDLEQWMLISSWRAPKEGKLLRGLYSFSENFSGQNGHLLRRARFGNQWVRTMDGAWREQTQATFSFDGTGRKNRMDRYMGIEDGQFFLSHGGFVEGRTKFGELFERAPMKVAPVFELPN